jgi:hypothetical protein
MEPEEAPRPPRPGLLFFILVVQPKTNGPRRLVLSIGTAITFSRSSVVSGREWGQQMSTSKPICGCAKKRFEERLRKIAKAPPPKPGKEEAPGRVTRASYAETHKKQLSEIGSLSLRKGEYAHRSPNRANPASTPSLPEPIIHVRQGFVDAVFGLGDSLFHSRCQSPQRRLRHER